MKYLPKSRSRHPYRRSLLILSGVFGAGVVIFFLLDSLILSLITPAWKADNIVSVKVRDFSGFFSSRSGLMTENARLRESVASLELRLASLSAELGGEGDLLALFGRTSEEVGILAAVLTHPPQTPYDILVIDAGFKDGVALGQRVVLPEGSIIGEVTEVFAGLSKVRLYTSSGMKTNAVLERNNMAVILEGTGAGNFRIEVPRETVVEIGDRILSPDLSARLLGIVEDSAVEPTDFFKEVLARSPVNIFNLRFVLIKR